MIDSIANRKFAKGVFQDVLENELQDEEECNEHESDQKFQIGDRVKYPASTLKIGIVADIWESFASAMRMYTVRDEEDGHCAMYAETQLEPLLRSLPSTALKRLSMATVPW